MTQPVVRIDLRQHLPLAVTAMIDHKLGPRGHCQYYDPCIIGSMIPEHSRRLIRGSVGAISATDDGSFLVDQNRGVRPPFFIFPTLEQIRDADILQLLFDAKDSRMSAFPGMFRALVEKYCPDELPRLEAEFPLNSDQERNLELYRNGTL